MNYGELKAAVADESHRTDLTVQIPSFIRRAEGMIARELRAYDMLDVFTLGDADRTAVGSPIYYLPTMFLEDRTVIADGRELIKVSLGTLQRYDSAGRVVVYSLRGAAALVPQIEFRANPALTTSVAVEYFKRLPTLNLDVDTNRVLDLHESIYLHAALFALYSWTQDIELAQAMYDTWENAVSTLNDQAGRYFGGTALTPALNLGHTQCGGGY